MFAKFQIIPLKFKGSEQANWGKLPSRGGSELDFAGIIPGGGRHF